MYRNRFMLLPCAPWCVRLYISVHKAQAREHSVLFHTSTFTHWNIERVIVWRPRPSFCPTISDRGTGSQIDLKPSSFLKKSVRSPVVKENSHAEPHRGSWVNPLLWACTGCNKTHQGAFIKKKKYHRYPQNQLRKASIIYPPSLSRKLGSS